MEEIVIAVVSCGMRQPETLNMIKSVLIFSHKLPLRFIVITDDDLMTGFREKLEDWRNASRIPFRYDVLPLMFPKDNEAEWRTLFKPCAAQRLFLPVRQSISPSFVCSIACFNCILRVGYQLILGNFAGHWLGAVFRHRHPIHIISPKCVEPFPSIQWQPIGCANARARGSKRWLVQPLFQASIFWKIGRQLRRHANESNADAWIQLEFVYAAIVSGVQIENNVGRSGLDQHFILLLSG